VLAGAASRPAVIAGSASASSARPRTMTPMTIPQTMQALEMAMGQAVALVFKHSPT
jgi:hypothetical protein